MYFLVRDYQNELVQKIVRVDLSGVDSLASETVTPSTDYVYSFDVDGQGNVIYYGILSSDSSNYIYRIRKSNGGLYNLSGDRFFRIGFDGDIYIKNSSLIQKITIDENYNLTQNSYASISERLYTDNAYKIEMRNKNLVLAIDTYGRIFELYNSAANPRQVSPAGLDLKSTIAVDSTENFYYIAGKDSSGNAFLVKIDPDTDTCSNILSNNDYEVYTFTAPETDGITFNVLRMSDGKKIIGKVGINGGAVTVIDEESNMQINYLERIN